MKKSIFFAAFILFVMQISSCTKTSDTPDNGGNNNGGSNQVDCSSGITSNTTWKAGTYIVSCDLDITSNATLTLDPGVIIRFTGEGGITTSDGGAINAQGTSSSPVIFTGEQETAGYWTSIDIYSNSTNNLFKYCQFKYGGEGDRSMVRVGDADYSYTGRASFQNCLFSNGAKNGLYLAENSFIDNSTNNTFTANAKYPVSTQLKTVSQLSTTNHYTGNGADYIYVSSDYICQDNVHFPDIEVPYYLTATANNKYEIYGDWVIDPGVTLAMQSNMQLVIGDLSGMIGSFKCIGTAAKPITIKGFQASKGFWDKIRFEGSTSSDNQFAYTKIQDGGSYADNLWGDKGMLTVINTIYGGSHLSISNCNLSNSLCYGIYVDNSTTHIVNGKTGTQITSAITSANNTITNCSSGTIHIE